MNDVTHNQSQNVRIEQRLAQADILRKRIKKVREEKRDHIKEIVKMDGPTEELTAEIEQLEDRLLKLTRSADWDQLTLALAGEDFQPLA